MQFVELVGKFRGAQPVLVRKYLVVEFGSLLIPSGFQEKICLLCLHGEQTHGVARGSNDFHVLAVAGYRFCILFPRRIVTCLYL